MSDCLYVFHLFSQFVMVDADNEDDNDVDDDYDYDDEQ